LISSFFHLIPNILQQSENEEEVDDEKHDILSSSSNNKFFFFSFHGQQDQIISIFDALEFHTIMSQKCQFSSYFFPCGSNISDDGENLSSTNDQNLIHFEEIENCFEVQNLNNLNCDHHFNGYEKLISDTIEEFINRHHAI